MLCKIIQVMVLSKTDSPQIKSLMCKTFLVRTYTEHFCCCSFCAMNLFNPKQVDFAHRDREKERHTHNKKKEWIACWFDLMDRIAMVLTKTGSKYWGLVLVVFFLLVSLLALHEYITHKTDTSNKINGNQWNARSKSYQLCPNEITWWSVGRSVSVVGWLLYWLILKLNILWFADHYLHQHSFLFHHYPFVVGYLWSEILWNYASYHISHSKWNEISPANSLEISSKHFISGQSSHYWFFLSRWCRCAKSTPSKKKRCRTTKNYSIIFCWQNASASVNWSWINCWWF